MIKQVLIDARALYVAAPSHAPRGKHPKPGTHCVVSAIFDASKPHDPTLKLHWQVRDAFAMAAGALEGEEVESIIQLTCAPVSFNATHTTEEVLEAFDLAIERAI